MYDSFETDPEEQEYSYWASPSAHEKVIYERGP